MSTSLSENKDQEQFKDFSNFVDVSHCISHFLEASQLNKENGSLENSAHACRRRELICLIIKRKTKTTISWETEDVGNNNFASLFLRKNVQKFRERNDFASQF